MDKREILKRLIVEAGQGNLRFQTHSAVAARIRQALGDPDISFAAVARLIQAEPVLAARIVAVANSLAFNASGRSIADLPGALSRLGLANVRALAMAYLVRQMGEGAGPANAVRCRMATQLWEHTAHVAALAQAIARRVTRQPPETALFAGIVHEVGGFYCLSRAADYPELLEGGAAVWDDAEIMALEAELGRTVAYSLALPEPIMAVLEDARHGFLALPPATLGDTLLLAERLAPVASPFRAALDPAVPEGYGAEPVPKESIEMVLGTETLSVILADAADEVLSLASALRL